jgi:hypothetical protein
MVRISARTATDARPSPSWCPRQDQLARQPAHGPHQRQRGRSGQLEHDASRRTPKRHGHADLRGRRICEPPSQHGRRVRWIEGGCPGPDAPSAGGCLNGLFFSSCFFFDGLFFFFGLVVIKRVGFAVFTRLVRDPERRRVTSTRRHGRGTEFAGASSWCNGQRARPEPKHAMLSDGSITKEDHGSMKCAVHRKFAEL